MIIINCIKCKKKKKHSAKGLCKKCYCQEQSKKYRKKYPNHQKEWRKINPKKTKEYAIKYREEDREKTRNYQRKWIKKNPKRNTELQKRYEQLNPKKIIAHRKTQKIKIQKGQLCEECNKNLAIHKHHPDYNKPLKIVFVCQKCHTKLDKKIRG